MTDPTTSGEWSESPHEPRDHRPDTPPLDVRPDPDDGIVTFAPADDAASGSDGGRWITVDAGVVIDLEKIQ
jgi:hypothetical protein